MTSSQFIDQIQEDASEGYCHTINTYEYNNRILGSTKITITTKTGECKKSTPVKSEEPVKQKDTKTYNMRNMYLEQLKSDNPKSPIEFFKERRIKFQSLIKSN